MNLLFLNLFLLFFP